MKFVTYVADGVRPSPGVLTDDLLTIVDLGADFADMVGLIRAGDAGLATARSQLAKRTKTLPRERAKLLAPLPEPPQFRDFNNHPQHFTGAFRGSTKLRARLEGKPEPTEEDLAKLQIPSVYFDMPIYYHTNRFSVGGPDSDVERPGYCKYLDYELEMAMIVGRAGKNIRRTDAHAFIFGYTIFNDFSARDMMLHELGGYLGPAKTKSFDTGNVIGPWIVTKDELPRPFDMKVALRINGELLASNTGKDMVHSFEAMIERVSEDETIHPGEIFGSGTYGGTCALENGRFLNDGDVVELEIEGIGVLRNRIIPARKK